MKADEDNPWVELIITVTCREKERERLRPKILAAIETELDVLVGEGRVDIHSEVGWESP